MGSVAPQESLFSLLPEKRAPWTQFVLSTGVQALVVGLLLWARLLHPEILSPPEHTYRSVQLVATPVPVNHQPQPVRELPKPVVVAQLDPPTDALRLPAPQPKARVKTEDDPAPCGHHPRQEAGTVARREASDSQTDRKNQRFLDGQFGGTYHPACAVTGANRRFWRSEWSSRQTQPGPGGEHRASRFV